MAFQGSANYIWYEGDILGQGASGAVYKARHKKTGELFAVKTFNRMTSVQSLTVQRREFEVMQKIKHENIVKLLAIEEESVSHVKVLIMELCTGGSLLTLLDEPANSYGFEEKEFFTVLYDVASGLQYLRETGIVHRDIKPGNILLYKSEDGRHIYKLTDFGAARELEEEEQFLSLCGTEEYLYPEMYARAVLKQSSNQHFDASVDLWSLGVTLYHTATGNLPFRPYGGRSNREVMHKITTEKKSGVISGVQHKQNAHIEYSRELPKTCRLTDGAKLLITAMLAGLMESNQDKMWTFNRFFDEVKRIKERKLIHVFNTTEGTLLHIYLKPDDKLVQVHEAIARQTDVCANMQHLILDRGNITERLSPMSSVQQYPNTSDDDPFFLFHKVRDISQLPTAVDFVEPSLPPILDSTSNNKAMNLVADYNEVKTITKSLYLIKQCMANYHKCQTLLLLAMKAFLFRLSTAIMKIQAFCHLFSVLLKETEKRINWLNVQHNKIVDLLKRVDGDVATTSAIKDYQIDGGESINTMMKTFSEISDKAQQPLSTIKHLYKMVIERNELDSQDITQYSCQDKLLCLRKIEVLYDGVEKTMNVFKLEKRNRSLSGNGKQIHMFERLKASSSYEKAVGILRNNCYRTTEIMFRQFYKWFRQPCEISQKVDFYESQLSNIASLHVKLSESLDLCQSQLLEKLESVQHHLKSVEDEYVVLKPEELSLDLRASQDANEHHNFKEKATILNDIKKEIQDIKVNLLGNCNLLEELQRLQ